MCGLILATVLGIAAESCPELKLLPGVPAASGCFCTNRGELPRERIDLEAVWSGDSVVVRLREFLSSGAVPRAKADASLPISMFEKGDSVIEVFLRPDPRHPEYEYQISVNPSNVVYAARNHIPWNGFQKPCGTKPFFGRDHWGVEFTIPFGAFGEAAPGMGEARDFEFAVGPYRWRAGMALRYGKFVFGAASEAVRVESVTQDADGVLHVAYAVDARAGRRELAHKGIRRYDVRFDAGEYGAGEEIVTDYDRGSPNWLRLDRYYYQSGEVEISYGARDFVKPRVSVRSIATGEILFSGVRAGEGTLTIGSLGCGEYAFEVEEVGRSASCEFEVVERSEEEQVPLEGSLRLEDGVLRADYAAAKGRPVFLLTGSQDVFGKVRLVNAMSSRYLKLPQGLHYRYELSDPYFGAERLLGVRRYPLEIARLAYEAQIPVAVARTAQDEAVPVDDNLAFYAERYRELKARFPERLFSVQVDRMEVVAGYAKVCDILEFALSYGANPLLGAKKTLDRVEAAAKGRPLVAWVGASLPDNGRSRTPDELNTLVRYLVLRGAVGCVWHLGHGGVPRENRRLWSYLEGAERRLEAWYPDWAEGTPVDLGFVADESIEVKARRNGGRTLVLAANLSPLMRAFTFRDSGTGKLRRIHLPGFGSFVGAL